jgi:NAD(P) transhydrogenase subunit alpha
MKLAVTKERRPGEARVAASPDSVKRLAALGFTIAVEAGAGDRAAMPDEAFAAAGATIVADPATLLADADVVLKVQRPLRGDDGGIDEVAAMKPGAVLVGMLAPYADAALLAAYAGRNISAFALELVPRITRAQTMDVLSSQANLAGYRAVLEAAQAYGRAFPMMMTAAGTVPAARVFVMGAGVAGLQAIATARRLGAVVTATDVRPAAKEQVESLGAKFVAVEDEEFKQAETAGGYAQEMSAAYREKQAALVAQHIAKQDIVVTTALIPGRPAPKLISAEMVASMKPGSVVVDLAVEQGGNCAGSRPDEIVATAGGVRIVGWANMPSRIPVDASLLYARNLVAFLTPLVDKDAGALRIDTADEIVKASLLTQGGAIVHPAFAGQAS